ncbi:hypothetical protein [Agromyces bracchium]|uniref:Uncharacterized protein n=1 Tax=Agromyces bracchium TaxID=88376 RepID=A0A6I3M2S7_9MICO|nr:hypothetical protein [Agromyces bracchium]MTH68900.1 hypothetical protein [Agromyces bracchium]
MRRSPVSWIAGPGCLAMALLLSACDLGAVAPSSSPSSPTAPEATETEPPAPASPVLTQAVWNEPSNEVIASGLVDGTLDASADCVFEFGLDGRTVTRETVPEPGPSSLDCGSAYVQVDELGPGTWSVRLGYGGTYSNEEKVEVPG